MDAAIVIALIALAGSLLSTAASVFGAPVFQARREAKKVLATYREPLLASAYELQARLHNILGNNFVEDYVVGNKAGRQDEALTSTLYVFGQFFAWREIIRREVQFLRFGRDEETREVARLLRDISETFLDDDLGPAFMIWRVEQRGLGERMITSLNGTPSCIGYAAFVDQRPEMAAWLDRLEQDVKAARPEDRQRLTRVQHLLVDLVRMLDDDRTRYPFELEKA